MSKKSKMSTFLFTSMKWTDDLVLKFIYVWREKESIPAAQRDAPRIFWTDIIKDLSVEELDISWSQARKKWSNLVNKYRMLRGSSSDLVDKDTPDNWPFFMEMEEALKNSVEEGPSVESLISKPVNLIWTDSVIIRLIALRKEKAAFFTGRTNSARTAWTIIVRELGLLDSVSWEQAKRRWNYLVSKYKMLKNPPRGISSERCQEVAQQWPFYAELDYMFQNEMCDEISLENSCSSPTPMNVSWTEGMIIRLIRIRKEKKHLFTGQKHSARQAWTKIITELGVEDAVSWKQARKKWNNLVTKYKVLSKQTQAPLSRNSFEKDTPETWPFYKEMERSLSKYNPSTFPHVIRHKFARLPQNDITYKKHPPKKRKNFSDFIGAAVEESNAVVEDLTNLSRNSAWTSFSVDDSSTSGKPVMLTWANDFALRLMKLWEGRAIASANQGENQHNVWAEIIKDLGLEKTPSWEHAKRRRYYPASTITHPQVQQQQQQPSQSGIGNDLANPVTSWTYYSEADLAFGTAQIIPNATIVETQPITTTITNEILEPSIIKVKKNDSENIISSIEESHTEIKELLEFMKREGDLMCSAVHTLVSKVQ